MDLHHRRSTSPPPRHASLDELPPRLHRDLGVPLLDVCAVSRSPAMRDALLRHLHRGR